MKTQKPSPKLRLSYSLLNLWSTRRFDEAIKLYLRLPIPTTPQLEDGKKFHKEWADSINKTKELKIGRSTFKFNTPTTEHEQIVSYSNEFNLKGIFDCLDKPLLWEFKTGTTSTADYARSYQIPFYFLIAELAGIEIEAGYLYHYDQYKKDGELIIIHNSKSLVDDARNFVDSLAPEILLYFKEKKVLLDK